MKNMLVQACVTVAIYLPLLSARSNQINELNFFPEKSTHASIKISNQELSISSIFDGAEKMSKIQIDTENLIHLELNDYNFDGNMDFSVHYLDGGMGAHLIYRIFVFSKKNRNFIEIMPKCGDQFADVRLVKKSKRLFNTYYSENLVKTCWIRY